MYPCYFYKKISICLGWSSYLRQHCTVFQARNFPRKRLLGAVFADLPVCLGDRLTNCTSFSQTGVFSCLANNYPKAVQRESETDVLKHYIKTQRDDQQESSRNQSCKMSVVSTSWSVGGKSTVGEMTHGSTRPSLLERMSINFHFLTACI